MTFYGDAEFIAGKDFDTEYGHHEAGSVVKEAHKFYNLDVLVSGGWLFPVVPDEGYDTLPPHLFSLVITRQEALDAINRDNSHEVLTHVSDKAEVVVEAEKQVKQDEEARAVRATIADQVHRRQLAPKPVNDTPL